jgi:hypothetical protein
MPASEASAMIRGFIAGAMLFLESVTSEAQTTVKEFTTSMGNPDKKGIAELYAIGVGHGFFLVSSHDGGPVTSGNGRC